ncbi:DUF1697 domain-containing protein [Salipiger sp. HF18]|nr:DUF1697 domain-containing protein [Salipiger sp. HF18]
MGGANAPPMKELRGLCDTLGWRDVESCISSCNLAFDVDDKPEAQAGALREVIRAARGFDMPVLVLTEATLRHARDDCPLTPDAPRQLHADFLVGAPERPPARAGAQGRGRRSRDGQGHSLAFHARGLRALEAGAAARGGRRLPAHRPQPVHRDPACRNAGRTGPIAVWEAHDHASNPHSDLLHYLLNSSAGRSSIPIQK